MRRRLQGRRRFSRLLRSDGNRETRHAYRRFPETAAELRSEFLVQLFDDFLLLIMNRRREGGVVGDQGQG